MSKRRDKRVKGPARRRYDLPMIRDFLDHLLWEVRINHAENTSLATATGHNIHPELAEQLSKYQRKYRAVLRAGFNMFVPADMPREDAERAVKIGQQRRAAEHQKYIDALETLAPLFKEAMFCASRPGLTVIQVPAARILDGTWWKDRPGGDAA